MAKGIHPVDLVLRLLLVRCYNRVNVVITLLELLPMTRVIIFERHTLAETILAISIIEKVLSDQPLGQFLRN